MKTQIPASTETVAPATTKVRVSTRVKAGARAAYT